MNEELKNMIEAVGSMAELAYIHFTKEEIEDDS